MISKGLQLFPVVVYNYCYGFWNTNTHTHTCSTVALACVKKPEWLLFFWRTNEEHHNPQACAHKHPPTQAETCIHTYLHYYESLGYVIQASMILCVCVYVANCWPRIKELIVSYFSGKSLNYPTALESTQTRGL